ncbi:putative polygalacturonase At3g15720 [Bidens hawaiensis]|uniref:putative polygalacturonase At3g15720 n=1 Tax=Bidens hawaiensis TaxID=980011 RepID=UPI00404B6FD9
MQFLISPVKFDGSSCKSQNINIKLLGTLTAPNTLDGWKDCVEGRFWIYFTSVHGFTIDGPGQIDGQGAVWWRQTEETETCNRPTALHFNECSGLRLQGTTHINSPKLHISIKSSQDVDIGNLQIIAPEDSPNTDGIDISASSRINIHDSVIQTGDDCVAINGGVVDIKETNVVCGPGHGISIGSLGEKDHHDTVEQVRVQNCDITGTRNGLRIKTVPNGSGYAKEITFEDISLVNVENPIIIDQHYCNSIENHVCQPQASTEAVQVSDVTYKNIYGSSSSKRAINFDCSDIYKCTNIRTENVHITGGDGLANCRNTQGEFVDTIPSISCN